MRFLDVINKNKMSLVFSSPKNDYELVKTAWENGADAVKVHLNVHHHASQNNFGSFEEEYQNLKRILEESPVPVGVVLGGDLSIVVKDYQNVLDKGFDFCSLYYHHTPVDIFNQKKLTIMSAFNNEYDLIDIHKFVNLGTEVFEASIVHPDEYGDYLSMKDVSNYKRIKEQISIPLLVPSQKKIRPSDLSMLSSVGVDAVMLGAVVTTDNPETVKQVMNDFRREIDSL